MLFTQKLKDMQKNHFLHWNGLAANELLLLSLTGTESVSTPYCYEIRSLTELSESMITAMHGKEMSCQMGDGLFHLPQRHIHGVVTHIQRENNNEGQTVCVLRLEPAFALLRMGRSMRVWQNMTIPDLVRKLLSEHGINKIDMQLHNPYEKREFCIQYRESDFDFISRLLEEEGIYYFFKHAQNEHQMVLADQPASHPYAANPILPWHHHSSILSAGNIERWSSTSVLIPDEVEFSSYNVDQAVGITEKYSSTSKNNSTAPVIFSDVLPLAERSQLDSKAKNAMQAFEVNTTFYEAHVNAHWLSCGEIFTLSGHPTDSGSYRIHTLKMDAHNNFESNNGSYQCDITSLRHSVKWRPLSTHVPPNIAGILTAKVVGPSSEEIHTDKMGRVKIQFPWDTENKSDGVSSCWVRVSQPWTGKNFGGQFIPRVGSEVLVSFVQGNPDFPLVTGSVYNGQNQLPFTLPDEKTAIGFVSRSTSKGAIEDGHQLSFDDKKGSEKLTMTAQKDLLLTVKNDVTSKIGAKRDTEITKGDDTLVLKQGSLNITLNKGDMEQNVTGNLTTSLTNGNYSLTATGGSGNIKTDKTCVVESTQSIELSVGDNKITISPSGITLSGTMIKIEGEGMTTIKGGIINLN